MPILIADPATILRLEIAVSLPALCAPKHTKPPPRPPQLPIATGVRFGPAPLLRLPESFFEVPCSPRQLSYHFLDNALQIVSGYAKPPFQASNLAGVSQVNLVANGLRLGAVRLRPLPRCRPIALADDLFRYCQIPPAEKALLCRQPTLHLGGDAQPPGFLERIASPLSQRHLARFGDHLSRSGIPIMALRRLGGYSSRRRANHECLARIARACARLPAIACDSNGAEPNWSLNRRFACQYCSV